jgi:hypothetical protein
MENVKEIKGIPIKESMKYLGVTVFCDRQKRLSPSKTSVKNTCNTSKADCRIKTLHL